MGSKYEHKHQGICMSLWENYLVVFPLMEFKNVYPCVGMLLEKVIHVRAAIERYNFSAVTKSNGFCQFCLKASYPVQICFFNNHIFVSEIRTHY